MAPTSPPTVIPAEFPELASLCWNRDPARPLPEAEAFSLYERNWRHVRPDAMGPAERQLLERLTRTYGHGVFLG